VPTDAAAAHTRLEATRKLYARLTDGGLVHQAVLVVPADVSGR